MSTADRPEPASCKPSVSHSVTLLIQQLKQDAPDATARIWARFFERLMPVARARMRGLKDNAVDEEDILVAVFELFFRAARDGRFARLHDRDDLWQILLLLTDRKVSEQYRRANALKRGGDSTPASAAELNQVADQAPPPEFIVAFNDSVTAALQKLATRQLRDIALLRLEGYEIQEIAERIGIGLSSVERKLRLIREQWGVEFSRVTSDTEVPQPKETPAEG